MFELDEAAVFRPTLSTVEASQNRGSAAGFFDPKCPVGLLSTQVFRHTVYYTSQ